MKKVLSIIMMSVVALLLVSCKDKNGGGNGNGNGGNQKNITLSYADWGEASFNRKMLDAFENKYPHIKVELREDIGGSGDEFTGNLINAAQADLLPDVFATDNVPTIVNAGLTLDVAKYWDNDDDASLVYPNVSLAGLYNGKRYGVPSFQFIKGIMINKTIFEKANLRTIPGKYRIDQKGLPVKDWTFSEFIEIAKAITNIPGTETDAVVGLDTWFGASDFQQVWPMMDNANMQYDTWDGEKFHYNTDSWIEAMKAKVELDQLQDGTTLNLPAEITGMYDYLNGLYISQGYVAMDIEGSWQFAQINVAKDNGIDLGFWPYPSGSEGLFPPTILDFQAVSSQTQHPEEAFLLAKWMTFGKDGWEARLDILEANKKEKEAKGENPDFLIGFPIADYPGHAERIEALVSGIDGLQYSLDRMEYSKPDLDKWLPGYKDFWQWALDPDNSFSYEQLLIQGSGAVETFAVEWESKVNELVREQMAAY